MVCVPCFIIPLLLYIWHKFVQPILLRYWNPWEKKDAQGNVIKAGPEFPFECKGNSCPFVPGGKTQVKDAAEIDNADSTAATEAPGVTSSAASVAPTAVETGDETKKQI